MISNLALVVACAGVIALALISMVFAFGNVKEYLGDYKHETKYCKTMQAWYYRLDQDYTGDARGEHYDLSRAKECYQRALREQSNAFNRLLVACSMSVIFGFGGAVAILMSIHYAAQCLIP